ncbi:MAG: AmmeMemoRadiSam system protein B [Spirochaetales bacterium]|nr:AmmeMemoRadiSam system protein B [Spirochaetales bacterium]
MRDQVRIREPIVRGIFYPDERGKLEAMVDKLLAESAGKLQIEPGANTIISPHAGYTYCGAFVASAFLAAAGRPVETVIILAPVHREPEDALFLTESKYFSTPLGKIEVAEDIVSELEASGTRIYRNDIPHLEEHAIEVQLPFIQRRFPGARIVPILMGRATLTNARLLARALDLCLEGKDESTLIVISSNLSDHTDVAAASESVQELLRLMGRGDCEGLLSAYHKKDITACGTGCIATLFCRSRPAGDMKLLSKTDTQTNLSDAGKTIHYGAIAFYPAGGKA